jgi:SPP1 gp7 family putative phage head morphogenesis protein
VIPVRAARSVAAGSLMLARTLGHAHPPDQAELEYWALAAALSSNYAQVLRQETRSDDLQSRLRQVAQARARLTEMFSPRVSVAELARVAAKAVTHAVGEARRILGGPGPGELLEADRQNFIRKNVDLISTMPAEALDKLEAALKAGGGPDQIQKSIEEFSARARFIATDQTMKLNAQMMRVQYEQAGVPGYIWVTLDDGFVRPTHAVLHRTRHTWNNPPIVNKAGKRAHPGEDIHCRCLPEAVW